MKMNQVAVQLYSIRDYLKTPDMIAKSLHRIREIGYQSVELAGLGPMADKDLRGILDTEGLACLSSHEPGEQLFNDTARIIDRLRTLGCPIAVYPYPAGVSFETTQDVKSFALQLEKAGRALAEARIELLYHNHNIEFKRVDGAFILDTIFDSVPRNCLGSELDTYWVQAGGDSPTRWCGKLKGRLSILHMKDFGLQEHYEGVPSSVFKEIGSGNLDWKEIIHAAEKAGCRKFVVEQDANWMDNDPFTSLRTSFDFIREHLSR
jgi:sugar phosphate isomerase/epimerase